MRAPARQTCMTTVSLGCKRTWDDQNARKTSQLSSKGHHAKSLEGVAEKDVRERNLLTPLRRILGKFQERSKLALHRVLDMRAEVADRELWFVPAISMCSESGRGEG